MPLQVIRDRGLGWRPDLPDHRDLVLEPTKQLLAALPPGVDLRPQFPQPIYDQGSLGSCTGWAVKNALEFAQAKAGRPWVKLSALMIYWLEREMEGTIGWDAGAYIRDGFKAAGTTGAAREDLWPYDIRRFTQRPSGVAFENASHRQAIEYARVSEWGKLANTKAVLASGFPVVFGFSVYASFWDIGSNGVMPMPGPNERLEGGHAVIAHGYADAPSVPGGGNLFVTNQWGSEWGRGGRFFMPYKFYDSADVDDLWVVRSTETELPGQLKVA